MYHIGAARVLVMRHSNDRLDLYTLCIYSLYSLRIMQAAQHSKLAVSLSRPIQGIFKQTIRSTFVVAGAEKKYLHIAQKFVLHLLSTKELLNCCEFGNSKMNEAMCRGAVTSWGQYTMQICRLTFYRRVRWAFFSGRTQYFFCRCWSRERRET